MGYIEAKVRYEAVKDDGSAKKECDSYMVVAETFTEAEAKVAAKMQERIHGEFSVEAVKKSKIAEILPDETADKFWLVKWAATTYKEDGTEKRTMNATLVQADSLEHAVKSFNQSMRTTMADYELSAVQETSILEIFQD